MGVTKAQEQKANALMFKITNRPNILTSNNLGELVFNGVTVPNSNFEQLFSALFKSRSDPHIVGMNEFFKGLRQLNIEPREFTSNSIKTAYIEPPPKTGPLQHYEEAVPITPPSSKKKKAKKGKKTPVVKEEGFVPKKELTRTPPGSPPIPINQWKKKITGKGFPPGIRPRILYV
jgi:hypothetical protein